MRVITAKSILAAVSLSVVVLGGCTSVVVKPVSESNRTSSNIYDGRWLTTVTNTPGTQYGPGNWQFTCTDQSGENLGIVTVADGAAQFSWDENGESPAFVSDSGKFRFEIPTGIVAAAGGTSDASINNGAMTALIFGSLQSGKGNYTLGIAELGNAGCTSKVEFRKL